MIPSINEQDVEVAKYNMRSNASGQFVPKPVLPEFQEEASQIDESQPGGIHLVGIARHTGRVDIDSAYLPGNHRDALSKYTYGVEGLSLGDLIPPRRAIMIDAETGERLDERIVRVEQPEQLMASPENHRLLSKRTFGHLDNEGE